MGPLSIPTTGVIYVGACTVIHTVEKVQPYARLLEPLWEAAQRRTGTHPDQ